MLPRQASNGSDSCVTTASFYERREVMCEEPRPRV